ncbi:MAG TPA: hypothetical protein VM432_01765 [Bdellovibrionales bacterium]|nr:hypothetical protein [Bdellovibrionales bacterium]
MKYIASSIVLGFLSFSSIVLAHDSVFATLMGTHEIQSGQCVCKQGKCLTYPSERARLLNVTLKKGSASEQEVYPNLIKFIVDHTDSLGNGRILWPMYTVSKSSGNDYESEIGEFRDDSYRLEKKFGDESRIFTLDLKKVGPKVTGLWIDRFISFDQSRVQTVECSFTTYVD